MRNRCTGVGENGRPCKSWAVRGSQRCRWHAERAPLPVRLVLHTGKVLIPEPVVMFPTALRLTADAALCIRWYDELLAEVAARCAGTGQESLPLLGEEEPNLVLGAGGRARPLPLAALVICREDRLEVAIGAGNVYTLVEPTGQLQFAFREAAADLAVPGRQLTMEDLSRLDRGELGLRLRDGSGSPYLGFTYWAGQFLILASPHLPRRQYGWSDLPSPARALPDLMLLQQPPQAWAQRDPAVPAPVHHRLPAPQPLRQYTFQEVREMAIALADGPALRRWEPVEGEVALRHSIRGQPLQTKLTPGALLEWCVLPESHESLREELRRAGFPATLLLLVVVGLVLQQSEPVIVSLDDLIRDIGWKPRHLSKRTEMRRQVWCWLLLFDAMRVVGKRNGRYPDRRTGKVLDLTSSDALIRITGTRFPTQPALDANVPPLEVCLVAGPWMEKWRGSGQILHHFSDLLPIARLPAGKTPGVWAQSIGLALQQRFRERAHEAEIVTSGEHATPTLQYPPFTRRDLLGLFPCEPSVEKLLGGPKPRRAIEYWKKAMQLLKEAGIVDYDPRRERQWEIRPGWEKAWLDEPLDIQPAGPGLQAALEIARQARQARKKRGEPKA